MAHRIFGKKEHVDYIHRRGAYLVPIKDNNVAVVQTPKGFFFLGGGIDDGETDEMCITRECMEETGYTVSVKEKMCSAEFYEKNPQIGYFHPIQTYYLGELVRQDQSPIEKDHKLVWINYENLKGKMHVDIQNWALEQCWNKNKES